MIGLKLNTWNLHSILKDLNFKNLNNFLDSYDMYEYIYVPIHYS